MNIISLIIVLLYRYKISTYFNLYYNNNKCMNYHVLVFRHVSKNLSSGNKAMVVCFNVILKQFDF